MACTESLPPIIAFSNATISTILYVRVMAQLRLFVVQACGYTRAHYFFQAYFCFIFFMCVSVRPERRHYVLGLLVDRATEVRKSYTLPVMGKALPRRSTATAPAATTDGTRRTGYALLTAVGTVI